MMNQSKEIITIARTQVAIPAADMRKIRALLKKGNKIDAIGIIRTHTRVGVKHIKDAVEDPQLFEQKVEAPAEDEQPQRPSLSEQFRQWRRGNLTARQMLSNNPSPVIAAAAVVLVLSLSLVTAAAWDSPGSTVSWVWYLDTKTGELYESRIAMAPVKAPSDDAMGKATGVRAYMFTCGSCNQAEGQFVAYLETFTDEAIDLYSRIERGEDVGMDEETLWRTLSTGHQIRPMEDTTWIGYDSGQGRSLRAALKTRCDGAAATPCYPR